MTVAKEEAEALRRCIAILAPISPAHERRTMALNVEKRIGGQETALLAFRFTQLGALFHPSDAAKAQQLAQQMQAAAEAGELASILAPEHRGALVSDLAAWPDCPPIPEESPLRYWLPFMQKAAPAQSAAPVADSASTAPLDAPPPVTTGDIAHAFDGLRRWNEKAWKDTLGSPPKWLEACIALRGERGKRETRWNPVLIGAALVHIGHAKANSIRARFQTKPQLQDWLEAWKTYEADNFDTP